MYQMVSLEPVPSPTLGGSSSTSTGEGRGTMRKPNLMKLDKEDTINITENGRMDQITGDQAEIFEENGGGSIAATNNISHTPNPQYINHTNDLSHNHHHSPSYVVVGGGGGGGVLNGGGGGGDGLLQWGQRKRTRFTRPAEKLPLNGTMLSPPPLAATRRTPPPPRVLGGSTLNGRSRMRITGNSILNGKGTSSSGFLPTRNKNRNLEDPAGASPSRNGNSRNTATTSRSKGGGKRSQPSIEKHHDRRVSCYYGLNNSKEKSSDSNHVEENGGGQATGGGEGGGGRGEVVEWPRIYISLSRKEKEDDFYAMKGTKLPHRPKKRSKAIDRALQYCFPGMWLSDLTRARYEVRERKSKKPKRRGLKGLESLDSDSE